MDNAKRHAQYHHRQSHSIAPQRQDLLPHPCPPPPPPPTPTSPSSDSSWTRMTTKTETVYPPLSRIFMHDTVWTLHSTVSSDRIYGEWYCEDYAKRNKRCYHRLLHLPTILMSDTGSTPAKHSQQCYHRLHKRYTVDNAKCPAQYYHHQSHSIAPQRQAPPPPPPPPHVSVFRQLPDTYGNNRNCVPIV